MDPPRASTIASQRPRQLVGSAPVPGLWSGKSPTFCSTGSRPAHEPLQRPVLIGPITVGPSNSTCCVSQALSRSYWLMRRHGMIDFNKTGGLTLHSPEALADYIAAVSKSAQADVGAMRLFPANSNS